MSVDELITLLEGHPSATPVMAASEPPAGAIFMPVAVQTPPGPAPIAVLLVLQPVLGFPQARQGNGGRS